MPFPRTSKMDAGFLALPAEPVLLNQHQASWLVALRIHA